MSTEPKVTVKFTLEFERTLVLRQDNKPSHYSNVEWAKQQLEDICHEAEFMQDGRSECNYRITQGDLPEEIPT